jgi:hypothetical protein
MHRVDFLVLYYFLRVVVDLVRPSYSCVELLGVWKDPGVRVDLADLVGYFLWDLLHRYLCRYHRMEQNVVPGFGFDVSNVLLMALE